MPRSVSQSINEKPEMCSIDWTIVSANRFGSGSSSQASQSSVDICRICHCENDPQNPLLTPCYCAGSLKYVHQACLQQWLTASDTSSCELCKFPFIINSKIKPFSEWKSLDMSGVERRRLCCAILFNLAAALCVFWSLCVLIEKAYDEVSRNQYGWPFWTKLVVVTVGLTGGIVFMYIQCKQYLQLCSRWRARNRIILIQNAPEKIHPIVAHSPTLCRRHGTSVTGTGSISNTSASLQRSHFYDGATHAQVLGNIENTAVSSERDWILDDVSQMSFKPCRRGSGSLTPFHDSINNMFEPYTSSVQPTERSVESGITEIRPLESAIFIENQDILNEKPSVSDRGRNYYRHSSVLLSLKNDEKSACSTRTPPPARRYSDTKILGTKPLNLIKGFEEDMSEETRQINTPLFQTDFSKIQSSFLNAFFDKSNLQRSSETSQLNDSSKEVARLEPNRRNEIFKSLPNLIPNLKDDDPPN